MQILLNIPIGGLVIIGAILLLFLISLILLFAVSGKYKKLQRMLARSRVDSEEPSFLSRAKRDFVSVYSQSGADTNTPAIVENAASISLRRAITGERFLNSAVSLIITLGLFGTFFGLAVAVSSLKELVESAPEGQWLNIPGGILGALTGMDLVFYSALAGIGCALLLVFLRALISPGAQREKLLTMTELWLDHEIAGETAFKGPVTSQHSSQDSARELRAHVEAIRIALGECAKDMAGTLGDATAAMGDVVSQTEQQMEQFSRTIQRFNSPLGPAGEALAAEESEDVIQEAFGQVHQDGQGGVAL
ncbi:MAG: hypothetical protein ACOX8S_08200 [Christensenellales bacterium]|jgi:hypothetical protein